MTHRPTDIIDITGMYVIPYYWPVILLDINSNVFLVVQLCGTYSWSARDDS